MADSSYLEDSQSSGPGSQTWRLIDEKRVMYAMQHIPGDPATLASAVTFKAYALHADLHDRFAKLLLEKLASRATPKVGQLLEVNKEEIEDQISTAASSFEVNLSDVLYRIPKQRVLACDEPQLLPAAIKTACTHDAHAARTSVQPVSKPSYEQTLESLSELGIALSTDLQVLESRLRSHISSLESELNLIVDEQKEMEMASAAMSTTLEETCATRDALEQRAGAVLAAVQAALPSTPSSTSSSSTASSASSRQTQAETLAAGAVGSDALAHQLECGVQQLVEHTARLAPRPSPRN